MADEITVPEGYACVKAAKEPISIYVEVFSSIFEGLVWLSYSMLKSTPVSAEVMMSEIVWPAGINTSAGNVPVHVSKFVPLSYTGLVKAIIEVVPYFNSAVINGLAGILPETMPMKLDTDKGCPALMVRELQSAGFWVKVVELEPPLPNKVSEIAEVLSAVAAGSIRSSDCEGLER